MLINLSKNRDELQGAHKDVLNDTTPTNWALFGYEDNTYNLRFISKGDGGLEELESEFDSSRIMYAFCRVKDPNSGLTKFMLVNWQGEGAPIVRKGCCANHVGQVARFFAGHHVTVNARTDEDIEPEALFAHIAKCSTSRFDFKPRLDEDTSAPVGSVYKRIQPAREISSKQREAFWAQEQAEQKKRADEDRKAEQERRMKAKEEETKRELEAAKQRELQFKERSATIDKVREAEKNAANFTSKVDTSMWERQIAESQKDEVDRRRRAEMARRERSHEAQQLISKTSIRDAKAMFEAGTCAGRMSSMQQQQQQQPIAANGATWRQNNNNTHHAEHAVCSNGSNTFEPPQQQQHEPVAETKPMPDLIPKVVSPLRENSAACAAVPATTNGHKTMPEITQQTGTIIRKDVEKPAKVTFSSEAEIIAPPQEFCYTRNLLAESLNRQESASVDHADEEQNWDEPTLEAPPSSIPDPLADAMMEQGIHRSVTPQQSPKQIISASPPDEYKSVALQQQQPKQPQQQQQPVGLTSNSSALYPGNGVNSANDKGLCARALYDYQAGDDTEISFDPDDVITHIDQIDEGWWQGMAPNGMYGLFPANYVEIIN